MPRLMRSYPAPPEFQIAAGRWLWGWTGVEIVVFMMRVLSELVSPRPTSDAVYT
jgi:hypothetical protein